MKWKMKEERNKEGMSERGQDRGKMVRKKRI